MKKFILYYLSIWCLFMIFGFGKSDDSESNNCIEVNGNIKIMPLGASRVQGYKPFYESYRYDLWNKLMEGGWDVDFVGNQDDDFFYGNDKEYCFDIDHQSKAGWTSAVIDNQIDNWLNEVETPDIVLFSSPGANDIILGASLEEIVPNIHSIITKIQAHNPDVTILIEQMAPPKSTFFDENTKLIVEEVKSIINEIAQSKTTEKSLVIAVDMFTDFTDNYLADEIHYNAEGARLIANRYYESLIPFLEN